MNVRIKRNNLENNVEKIDYNRIVESLDKDLQTFYKEIIETTPIDVNFSTIAEVCKNDKKALDITFACICCDLISKYIDAHSVAEKFKKETGTDMDSVSVELMFFILYMLELHTQYEKFLEEQRKYAKEIGKIMDRQAEKSAKLYGISIEYMKHQNIL